MQNFWLIAGGVIILILASYALYLCWQLWKQNQRQKNAPTHIPNPARLNERRKSIFALANAIEEEALTLTEGCLRITAVASQIGDMTTFNREVGVISRGAEETAHIPILDAWKQLSKAEQRTFDKQRQAIESKYREAVLEAVERLKVAYNEPANR